MSALCSNYSTLIENMGVPDLQIPLTAVKFYRGEDEIPTIVNKYAPENISLTSCQASKQAALGDPVCLTRQNIGCIAAAISFGIVDQFDETPLEGPRVYTDIMKNQSNQKKEFSPPSPKDFTDGIVYACQGSGHDEFSLFGPDDSGRYNSAETAKRAIADMPAIQPADTIAVFFFPYDFKEIEITPDVVVLSTRPVELARIIQAYQYNTGKRVTGSMGAVRVVNSDLIVRPYLTQEINISTYCVGARLIGQYEGNRLGIGLPWQDFLTTAKGMKDSRTGFPFHLYPDADNT